MSQAAAWPKSSSRDIPPLCSGTTSRGDIYMKGTDLSHPGLDEGGRKGKDRKRLRQHVFPRDQIAGYIWTEASGGTEYYDCLRLYRSSRMRRRGKVCV